MRQIIRLFLVIALFCCSAPAIGQGEGPCGDPLFFPYTACDPVVICEVPYRYNSVADNTTECAPRTLFQLFYTDNFAFLNVNEVDGGITNITVYGPFTSNPVASNECAGTLPLLTSTNYPPGTEDASFQLSSSGYYLVSITTSSCVNCITFLPGEGGISCPSEVDICRNCIASFAPKADGVTEYVITGWAKEDNAPATKTSYTDPFIRINFEDAGNNVISSTVPFAPKGEIIDGWQRIEGRFTIPSATIYIDLELNTTGGDVYFDDVRVHPFDGSMVTYVYDPVSMRLVAQLDERAYSTLYEYDEEGRLKRVKKETEKGIMTIQETTTSTVKRGGGQ